MSAENAERAVLAEELNRAGYLLSDVIADNVVASDWLAEHDRQVAATALRVTAADLAAFVAEVDAEGADGLAWRVVGPSVSAMSEVLIARLRDRADRIGGDA